MLLLLGCEAVPLPIFEGTCFLCIDLRLAALYCFPTEDGVFEGVIDLLLVPCDVER
jgi:hypothetical protein